MSYKYSPKWTSIYEVRKIFGILDPSPHLRTLCTEFKDLHSFRLLSATVFVSPAAGEEAEAAAVAGAGSAGDAAGSRLGVA